MRVIKERKFEDEFSFLLFSKYYFCEFDLIWIAYLSSNCHVEIEVREKDKQVKKEKNENTAGKVRLDRHVRVGVRKATAAALRARKWVQVGKKN